MRLPSISRDASVCSGQPCVRGTRVPVAIVLRALVASGIEAVLLEYPGVRRRDVVACCEYAARLCEAQAHCPHRSDGICETCDDHHPETKGMKR